MKTVRGSHGWENENATMLAPNMLGIHGGMSGRFTKQATTFPAERNTPSAGTKEQAIYRFMMGENPILKNPVRGGTGMVVGTRTTAATTEGKQQGAGRESKGWSALTEAVRMFGPATITQEFSKNF